MASCSTCGSVIPENDVNNECSTTNDPRLEAIDITPVVNKGNEDEASGQYYFDLYAHFSIHEMMLKDEVRTGTYQRSIYNNKHLFAGKTVIDIGCGTGILSMFAAKAGAKKVLAIECSEMVEHAKKIIKKNQLDHIITVIEGEVEDVILPHGIEQVDVIISEWMGSCLFYENMLETVLYARDKWLKPDGILFPDRCCLYVTAIENCENKNKKINWWNNVYGFDMSPIRKVAIGTPRLDVVHVNQVVTNYCMVKQVNLYSIQKSELEFTAPFHLRVIDNGYIHALAMFFTVEFTKCHEHTVFSTGPESPETHWKQTIFYFEDYIALKRLENIYGSFSLKRNSRNNRDLDITIGVNFDGELQKVNEVYHYRMR